MKSIWVRGLVVGGVVCLFGSIASVPASATPPAITVTLAGSVTGQVHGGEDISYTLTVSNAGTTDSGPVTVTANIPDGVNYDQNSQSCGPTPNCTFGLGSSIGGCSAALTPDGVNTLGCRNYITSVVWNLSSVAASAANLTLFFSATVLSGPLTATANWQTDGCPSAGCPTNEVSNPGASVVLMDSSTPLGWVHYSEGAPGYSGPDGARGPSPPVLPEGQRIDHTISVSNSGNAPSGTISVTEDLPTSGGLGLVPGSASCGSVPGCTVSVLPVAACSSGSCPGTQVHWTVTSVSAGASNLDLSFASVVLTQATSTAASSQTLWNGPLSPHVQSQSLSGLTFSGDGCIYESGSAEQGCYLATQFYGLAAAPIKQVTSPHTGEPWAGSLPYEVALLGVGGGLIAIGMLRRRQSYCQASVTPTISSGPVHE